jgi:Na+-driven multidrug efflux pump
LPQYTDLGVNGVRWAMVIAMIIRAGVFAIYFKSGRWKTKTV